MNCDSLISVARITKLRLPAFKCCHPRTILVRNTHTNISSPLKLVLVLNSSRWWEVLWSLSSRHRKPQVIPTTNPSFRSPLNALQVTGADFFFGSTITKYLKVSLSLSKLLVYSNKTEALNPDLLNKKEMVYCDLNVEAAQMSGWKVKQKIKDKGHLKCLLARLYLRGRGRGGGNVTCSNIDVATFPLLSKLTNSTHGFFYPVSFVLF